MRKFLLLSFSLIFITNFLSAQSAGDFRSIAATGNWDALATWQRHDGAGWVAAPSYPGQFGGTGVVTIQDNHSITLNVSPANSIGSLVIQTGGNNTTLSIGAFTLNVTGNVLIDVSTANVNKTIAVTPSGVLNCASLTMAQGNNDNRKSYLTFILGTVNVTGDITMGADPDRTYLQFLSGGTLNVGGNVTGGNIIPGTGTVNFNKSGDQNIPGYSYHNLTISNGAFSFIKELVGNIPSISGTFLMTSSYLELNNFNITLNAAASTTATCHIQANGNIILNGTGQLLQTAGGGTEALVIDNQGVLNLNSPTSAIPVMDNYTIAPLSLLSYYCNCNQTINTNLDWGKVFLRDQTKTLAADLKAATISIQSSTTLLVPASQQITLLDAPFTFSFENNGTFSPGTGKVLFAGSNQQKIEGNATTFYDLEVNKTGSFLSPEVDVNVSHTLSLTNRTIHTNANTITLTNATPATQLSGGSASSYVFSTGAGRLRRNGLNNTISNALFPVGTSSHYLPVEISQSGAAPADFGVNVFQGATTNGVDGGTAMPDKTNIVNAIWNVDRPTGSGAATVRFNWINSLEGSVFSGYGDAAIKIAKYNSGWSQFGAAGTGGTANAAANQASEDFTSFSPFLVGGGSISTTLPVKFGPFKAYEKQNGIQLDWKVYTEENVRDYIVERSADARSFNNLGSLPAIYQNINFGDYGFFDANPLQGVSFYRIKNVDLDGKSSFSPVIRVNRDKSIKGLKLYPNPVSNGTIAIQGSNLERSNYKISLVNATGQEIYSQQINHSGGTISQTIELPARTGKGIYWLIMRNQTASVVYTEKVVVQ